MRGPLTATERQAVSESSLFRTADVGLQHARENLPYIRRTIADVPRNDSSEWAIVVAAGPSLHTRQPSQAILAAGFDGTIVAIDVALRSCLHNGLIPQYVLSLDPNPELIIRCFGDPDLHLRLDNDYFRRTELDPVSKADEATRNTGLIQLVNRYGPSMNAVLSTSVAGIVTRRVLDAGMEVYWWNPLYDDWEAADSYTRRVWTMNHVPCMVGGGNVGTAAWVFAHAVLRKQHIALVGMDFGYPPGTSVFNTQRYYELCEFFGEEHAAQGLIPIFNPHLGETWLTDPTYDWYRQAFIEMVQLADCHTYNCTEGGVVFGEGIHWTPLKGFLSKWKAASSRRKRRRAHGESIVH